VLEAINLGCVRGSRRLFTGLNFTLSPGELLELRGPNGSGKSSLLRIVCGLAAPAEGELRWHGRKTSALREEYFSELAYLGHQSGIKDELTASENLRIAGGVCGRPLNHSEAHEMLTQVGLEQQRHLSARSLSAGQRRRLAMAQFLALRAKLWVLDEILTSLDEAGMRLSRQLLAEHVTQGGMAMVATHQDLNIAISTVKRIELPT
jgi:heme exporter protein A